MDLAVRHDCSLGIAKPNVADSCTNCACEPRFVACLIEPQGGWVAHHADTAPPRRSAPFEQEPGFYEPAGLWLYGGARLLDSRLACIPEAHGSSVHSDSALREIEQKAEALVLEGKTIVTGIHNPAHQRAAVVPLRWGAPRILVLSGGFHHHLGVGLDQEPFRAARLWRHRFDPRTDLVISRRAPDKKPTYALHNPTVDRLIQKIVDGEVEGLLFCSPTFSSSVRRE